MKILIIGATSAIAKASARIYAELGCSLHLIARRDDQLALLASDLLVRGASTVSHSVLDLNKFAAHEKTLDAAFTELGGSILPSSVMVPCPIKKKLSKTSNRHKKR